MSKKKLYENVLAIVGSVPHRIPMGWSNIRSISIKTPDGASLPFYNKLPEELAAAPKVGRGFPVTISDGPKHMASKDDKTGSLKRKGDTKAKSPLVRALKKQKQQDRSQTAVDDTNPKEKLKDPALESTKLESCHEKVGKREITTILADKKIRVAQADKRGDCARVDYVQASRFSGSRKGYVFRNGNQGVGYYLDKKPVVDRMMLRALTQIPAQRTLKKGKKNKSGKKMRR